MKTAFSEGLWSLAGRVAIGGGVFIALAWLLAPEIRGLLQNGAIVTTDFQVDAWLHAASAPSFIAFMRWVSVFHGIASILCMTVIAAAAL